MCDIGSAIDKLIQTHIQLWQHTSKARKNPDLPSQERVELFMKTRDFNVLRAELRDTINKYFNSGYPDPKMHYKRKSNDSV